jgi:hypothetical protein
VGRPEELKAHLGAHRTFEIRLQGLAEDFLAVVRETPGVKAAFPRDEGVVFHTEEPETVNPQVVSALVRSSARIVSLSEQKHSLEEVYLSVMGGQGT